MIRLKATASNWSSRSFSFTPRFSEVTWLCILPPAVSTASYSKALKRLSWSRAPGKSKGRSKIPVVQSTESISTVLFDWDGTIIDSAQLGLNAYYKVFAELGCEFSEDVYNANSSPNWDKTYEALGLAREHWERADTLWRFHYDAQTPQLIEGAADTLQKMHANGYRLGIVSSGNDDRVNREIDQFGLRELLDRKSTR